MSDTAMTQRTAISNHRIELFRCPWLFYQKVFLKFKELQNAPAERGTWAHKFLERYVQHLLDEFRNQDMEYAEVLFESLWTTEPMSPEFKKELWDLTVGYVNTTRFDIEKVAAAEMSINLDWNLNTINDPFDKAIWLRARIDLLSFESDEVAMVEDYKSSWKMIPETDLREDLQAKIYAWTVFHIFQSVQKITVRFRWIRYKRSTETTFSRADVADVEQHLRDISRQIEYRVSQNTEPEKAWPPKPGEVCTYCPVQCPAVKNLADTDQVVVSQEQALRLAGEYIALDKAYEKHKTLLKAWIDVHGPLEVGGRCIGYFAEARNNYDSKTILDTLMGQGYDVEGLFNVSSDGVKEFLKKHPETAGLFSTFRSEKSQTKFMIGKPAEVITDVDKQPKPKPKKEKKKKEETTPEPVEPVQTLNLPEA